MGIPKQASQPRSATTIRAYLEAAVRGVALPSTWALWARVWRSSTGRWRWRSGGYSSSSVKYTTAWIRIRSNETPCAPKGRHDPGVWGEARRSRARPWRTVLRVCSGVTGPRTSPVIAGRSAAQRAEQGIVISTPPLSRV